jgi:dolichol kinase
VPAVFAWTGLVAAVEAVRLFVPKAKPLYDRFFGGIIREKEATRLSGTFYGALGISLSLLFFGANPAIAVASVLYLALGDAVSPLVGLRFGVGRYKVRGTDRSVDGTLAAIAVAVAIGLATGFSLPVALGAAAAFSLVDTIPIAPDDNFWIPIVSGAALFFLSLP